MSTQASFKTLIGLKKDVLPAGYFSNKVAKIMVLNILCMKPCEVFSSDHKPVQWRQWTRHVSLGSYIYNLWSYIEMPKVKYTLVEVYKRSHLTEKLNNQNRQ